MKTLIIAEAGVNHNGNLDLAKQLVIAAKESGADFVKFQTWKTEQIIRKGTQKANYQISNTGEEDTQFEMLKKLELPFDAFRELKLFCQKVGIGFMSTPDDLESAKFLSEIQEIFKIGSGEIDNVPLLRCIGSFKKKVIISTGMATLAEVEDALDVLEKSGTPRNKITVLHCVSDYPAKFSEVNLLAMNTISRKFGVAVGFSDHTLGIEIAIAAVALGASVIEKHLTLDTTMKGPDHSASLNLVEFKSLVQAIRNTEIALGDGTKAPGLNESLNLPVVRKSIVAKEAISVGDLFTADNLTLKRPGTGISGTYWDELIGKVSIREYNKDDFIEL